MSLKHLMLFPLLYTLSGHIRAQTTNIKMDECHYISECERAFKNSQAYKEMLKTGKKIVLVELYKTNDHVVHDTYTHYYKEVLQEGMPGADVITITLGEWVEPSGYISDNRVYYTVDTEPVYRKKEENEVKQRQLIIEEQVRKAAERKRQDDEFNASIPPEVKQEWARKRKLKTAEDKLKKLQTSMEEQLIFGVPTESMMTFLIDGSGSVLDMMPNTAGSFLNHAVNQLKVILSLLTPDQNFSVGFFNSDGPKLFMDGIPMPANEKNIRLASDYLKKTSEKINGDSEKFNETIKTAFRQSHFTPPYRYEAIYIFSDMGWSKEDMTTSEGLINNEGSKVYVSLYNSRDKNEANAKRITRNGRIMKGSAKVTYTPEEMAKIKKEIAALKKEIKALSVAPE